MKNKIPGFTKGIFHGAKALWVFGWNFLINDKWLGSKELFMRKSFGREYVIGFFVGTFLIFPLGWGIFMYEMVQSIDENNSSIK